MVKVKNIKPGIVIIADAGLKLGPGEVGDIGAVTDSVEKAVDGGLIAIVETEPEPEPKPRTRTAQKNTKQTDDGKSDVKQDDPRKPDARSEPKSDAKSADGSTGVENAAG